MKQNLFTYLPSEIIIDILSRLPVGIIIICKCVCKSWLGLLKTQEFVESHLSKSVPCLAVYVYKSILHMYFEFQDGLELDIEEIFDNNPPTKFTLPFHAWIGGSANGLLFMNLNDKGRRHSLYICNQITRDYIELKCPHEFIYSDWHAISYGFGVSKITGQLKLVQVFQNCRRNRGSLKRVPKHELEFHVYTIGTGSWRRVTPAAVPLLYPHKDDGAFVNGNLHWLVADLDCSQAWISCFDLETELVSTFSAPLPFEEAFGDTTLTALGDCLCLCNNNFDDIEIWLMKEYEGQKSWTKEFVIPRVFKGFEFDDTFSLYVHIWIVKVFKNGDILMDLGDPFYYSKENNTIEMVYANEFVQSKTIHYVPSFLSLKNFEEIENVRSF